MNTYIQDKLDEFDKLKDKDGYNSDDGFDLGYDGFDISRIRYWVEQALTDYHNHIVEEVKEFRHRVRNLPVSSDFDIEFDDFISLLQDTKE